ncbi:glycoside hydrolase family 25 protein [Subtercola sp. PAMC28395]|nr:glycoside hydrolase family 25 protein [Subtercola sp. PAMC28395]
MSDEVQLVIARAGTLESGGMLQDSKLTFNRDNARRLGKSFGTYLFNGPVDPVQAAEWYVSIIDYRPGDLTAIDVESPNAWNPDQVIAFHQRVKELIGVTPATYGSSSLLFQPQWKAVSDIGSPLWVANYGANDGTPGRDPGNGPWATRILWQYTSVARHAGFGGSVDTNLINYDALAAYLGTVHADTSATTNQADLERQIEVANSLLRRSKGMIILGTLTGAAYPYYLDFADGKRRVMTQLEYSIAVSGGISDGHGLVNVNQPDFDGIPKKDGSA